MSKKVWIPLWYRLRKRFGADVVAMQDHDGAVTWAVAHQGPFGLTAERMPGVSVTLKEDGTVGGRDYVQRWVRV